MVKFYAKLSKTGRAVFDAVYWIIFLLLLMFLNDQLGVVMHNAESGMPEFQLGTAGMLYVSGAAVLFSSVKILLYKGEKNMAFAYQNKKNQPPADPFLADDDDDLDLEDLDLDDPDFPDDLEQERKKPAHRAKRKRRKAADDAHDEPQIVQGITAAQYLHQNEYVGAAVERRAFMKNSCNTYVIQMDKQIEADGQKYTVPVEFQSFYLHFEFKNSENETDKLEKDVIDDIKFYLASVGNNEIVMRAKIFYRPYREKENQETFTFKLTLNYDECGQINAVKLGYEEERISILSIPYIAKQAAYRVLGRIPAGNEGTAIINNDMGTKMDFPHTTRKHHLNAIGTKKVRFFDINSNPMYYTMDVQCFKSFCSIDCPVCGKPVEGLGVPGIVLYGNSNWDALQTSNELWKYLKDKKDNYEKIENASESKLIDIVDAVIRASYEAIKRKKVDSINYAEKKSNMRIPLGHTVLDAGYPRTRPYNYTEKTGEYEFLCSLNEKLCGNLDDAPADKLYLLKPCREYNPNHYVHNTMITQLCSHCYNQLPNNFYMYDSVVTIYFYGNPYAGKTTLLLSEKNVISDTTFNNLFISCKDDDFLTKAQSEQTLDYQRKATELSNGRFPIGTPESEIIPGLLSPFEQCVNGVENKYLFNYYDMRGANSRMNWNAATNFVYVHSLMDDPSSLMGESFYQSMYYLVDDHDNQRRYNVQFFLTMIDEYPAFLYERIKEHNQNYENCTERKEILAYSTGLLKILEENLCEDFSGRAADEVISKPIQTELLQIEGLGALDFSKSYIEVHKEIYRVCRPIVDAQNDPRKQICEIVLRYLHGLDVVRDNYFMFHKLVLKLLTDMKTNAANNEHSNFWFSVYAVSATGFTAIEATNKENRDERAQYMPLFVKEANRMLQQSTFDYIKDTQNLQKRLDGLVSDNYTYCRDYLFSNGSVCDIIEDMYREGMKPSELFGKGIADLQRQGSIAADLAAWYLKTQKTEDVSGTASQAIPAAQGGGNLSNPINANEIAAQFGSMSDDGGAVSVIKKRKMRD